MARPITLTAPVRDARKELTEQLQQAPAEHAEALLEVYELLQQLHDRQILALMRGALAAGDTLVESATRAADSPPAIAALCNLVILGKALGSIDPVVTRGLAAAVTETMGATQHDAEPPSLLSLLGHFRRKEVRRGIAFVNNFLGALGRHVGAAPSEKTQEQRARVPSQGQRADG
jgi:uncharacterized protein YjgD (DUF1641 family)